MTTYAVMLEQKSEGCDYSIDCGKTWVFFDADNLQQAYVAARNYIMHDPNEGYPGEPPSLKYYDDHRLSSAYLVQVKSQLPIEKWYDEWEDAMKRREEAKQVEKEKADLARLKAKYSSE